MQDHNHDHGHDHSRDDQNHGTMRLGGPQMWIGILVGLAIVGLLLAKGAGWFGGGKHETAAAAPFTRQGDKIVVPKDSPLRARIATAPAETRDIGAKLILPAIVESDPARTANLLSPLSGRVVELRVGLGDRVTQGQVLAVLDSPDLSQAYDDDDKAADQLHLTEMNMHRLDEQFAIGAASARDRDQAHSDHAQARAEHVRTQARLRAVGMGAVDDSQPRKLVIKAPIAGSVTALNVARGNMINDATQPIMTLADLSTIWVTAMVPEKDLAAVAKDQTAEVALDAYPGQVLKGKVLFVSDVVEPDTRRNKIRIAFVNPHIALKPNMYATVTLLGNARKLVVLPNSALLMNNDRTTVFVANGDWVFERKVVEPSLEDGPQAGIASGVAPGEMVVVKGGILLND